MGSKTCLGRKGRTSLMRQLSLLGPSTLWLSFLMVPVALLPMVVSLTAHRARMRVDVGSAEVAPPVMLRATMNAGYALAHVSGPQRTQIRRVMRTVPKESHQQRLLALHRMYCP